MQLQVKTKIALHALQQGPRPSEHAYLAMWATISPPITPVGLLYHAGTSKYATLLLHLDYITLNLLQPALLSRHIASLFLTSHHHHHHQYGYIIFLELKRSEYFSET
jgi:hypothetical protein